MKKLPEFLRLISGDMNADNTEPVDLLLAEPVGFDPETYTGMSSRRFAEGLGSIPKTKPVNLLINTLGGRIDEGVAMHNMILARGNVTTCVIGFAASMGAVIAQAGVKRQMMPGTMMIVHNPQASGDGEADDFDSAANMLRQQKANLVNLFSNRSGQSKKKISDMMDETTMMNPDEAEELGFCDEVITTNAAWNSIEKIPADRALKTFRTLTNSAGGPAAQLKIEPVKQMKTLTAALAAVGLLPSADLTDEAAIVTAFNGASKKFTDAAAENISLKAENGSYKAAQKIRVEAAVALAVTNKIIPDARKQHYIDAGLRDETELTNSLADLTNAKGETIPARRGAAPLPVKAAGEKSEVETKMESLRNELGEASASRKVEISRELRELRGHKDILSTATVAQK
jgi:ATP-dependent Clp endopeptidase proteolytic subunit ClpP